MEIDTLLNVVGIVIIIISIIVIYIINKKEKSIYSQISSMHDDVKYYYNSLENMINSFDDLVENSINKIEKIQDTFTDNNKREIKDNKAGFISKDILMQKNIINDSPKEDVKDRVYKKIYELKKLGLSNKEIAQKLKIGIREVEIIINMMENL